ncbi:MAG: hypothetical protein HDR50_00220 [Desulfovibrio sp.]|uniref:hypothetical protein n=1 Tax=Desulfovibrio sp. TaxID=885 RepID=UPI001A787DB9|nr:hypothetical protein [Desulfovibrio sp.]MBD5416119.1 hypothetical protein [Desulfovibrio sp.]
MAFADLNFTAALWQGRGLRWLAAGADLAPELSLTVAPPASTPPPQRPAPRSPEAAAGPRPRQESRAASRPRQEAPPAAERSARWRPLVAAAMPEPWRSRLAATRPGRVAWTYWALGQDLAAGKGAPDGEEARARATRRAFLARLLRDLAHPAGTHTFWPACLPQVPAPAAQSGGDAPYAAHADAFWSGAAHLGCRAVIVMGSAAVRALGLPARSRPLAQLRWLGQLVLVLWDVDVLAGDEARYAPTLAFLRQGLAPAVRVG